MVIASASPMLVTHEMTVRPTALLIRPSSSPDVGRWSHVSYAAFTPAQQVARNKLRTTCCLLRAASCVLRATCYLKQQVTRNTQLVAGNKQHVNAAAASTDSDTIIHQYEHMFICSWSVMNIKSLDFTVTGFLMKLFKSSNINLINKSRHYFNNF